MDNEAWFGEASSLANESSPQGTRVSQGTGAFTGESELAGNWAISKENRRTQSPGGVDYSVHDGLFSDDFQ